MDNRSGEMAVFVRVVLDGSFSAAAKTLDLSPSAVSKLITRLEERLGVALFLRSTRGLRLTAEGEEFFEAAQKILDDLDDAEQAIGAGSMQPQGMLRVNASIPFGTHQLLPLVSEFRVAWTERADPLVRERVDVAVRAGKLADGAFRARLLGVSRYAVVASPEYLRRHGTPAEPDDLSRHTCLGFTFRRSVSQWPFMLDGERRELSVRTQMLTNNGETMRGLALNGVGIARLGRFHIDRDIHEGRLVELLEDFNPGDSEELHALFLAKRHMSRRVRVFIDFLVERVSPALEASSKPLARRSRQAGDLQPK